MSTRSRCSRFFLCLALGWHGAAVAQLSPGKLSRPHAGLEGAARCLDCHSPRQGVAAERCLACHGALAQRIELGRGLHARSDHRRCETCHIEHHGREFELIFWGEAGPEGFEHELTGWDLRGGHRDLSCRQCHRPEHLKEPSALVIGKADPNRTFLGLGTACLDCHADEHQDQVAPDGCLSCHGEQAWTPLRGFDHSSTGWPLLGKHAGVSCASCHGRPDDPRSRPDRPFLQFAAIAPGGCNDCHSDPHQGRLGNTCATCHEPSGWRRINTAGFDHDRTRFPLTGRHRDLDCRSCHGEGSRAGQRLSFASCADCHQDPHRGRLGTSCAQCHQTRSWRLVDNMAFDHGRTRFPLRGAHQGVSCSACHGSSPRAGQRLAFASCADCHGDPHFGQLSLAAAEGNDDPCASCHTETSFVPSTFDASDHSATDFPLRGAHLAVACIDCHRPLESADLPGGLTLLRGQARAASPPRRFRFASTTCASCHADPHVETTRGLACESCHRESSFRGAEASDLDFDHGQATGFTLEGRHRELACADCHRGTTASSLRFDGLLSSCAHCHRDPHFATLAPKAPEPSVVCAECHHTAHSWDSSFDHGSRTTFPLEGAHTRLACLDCHHQEPPAEQPRTLSTACRACHGAGSFISTSSAGR